MNYDHDVVIIGAGPSGTSAASLLIQKGIKPLIIEKQKFPRFSIGESLLPQCMVYLGEAQLLENIAPCKFQNKDGAIFLRQGQFSTFEFSQKFSRGPHSTYQVKRAQFDKVLADTVEERGAKILYEHKIEDVQFTTDAAILTVQDESKNSEFKINTKFVIDASGFGRVLPRLLDLELPSEFPKRKSYFYHIKDNISKNYDRDKILITINSHNKDIWYWLIPFSDGTSSIGVVAHEDHFKSYSTHSNEEILTDFIKQVPELYDLLGNHEIITPCSVINGYSTNVKSLYGDRFVLLGNAGEFLDPIFSSGITLALKSASLAAPLVADFINSEPVNWDNDFVKPLNIGVETFKEFVKSWYDEGLQEIIFYERHNKKIREMVCSILAGYAWDTENSYVKKPSRVHPLAEVCRPSYQEKTL